MKVFENFDWNSFWEESDYALKEYVGKKPTDKEIEDIENELGYKLPGSYIELIKRCNGGIPAATLFCKGEYPVYITAQLPVFTVLIKQSHTLFAARWEVSFG